MRVTTAGAGVQIEAEPNDDAARAQALGFEAAAGRQRARVVGCAGVSDAAGDVYALGNLASGTQIRVSIALPSVSPMTPMLRLTSDPADPGAYPTNLTLDVATAGAYFVQVKDAGSTRGLLSQYILDVTLADSTIPRVTGASLPVHNGVTTSLVDRFTVSFSEEMGTSSVTAASNYELRGAGPDGAIGSADDVLCGLGIDYEGGLTATFSVSGGPLGAGPYRFTASAGLVDRAGTPMDADFTRRFTVADVPGFNAERPFNDSRAQATTLAPGPPSGAAGAFSRVGQFGTGAGPHGVAIGDFNGDTHPDLAVANLDADTVSILIGQGNGTFRAGPAVSVGDGPVAVVAGRLDGDSHLDLAVANAYGNTVSILRGSGSGSFAPAGVVTVGNRPRGLALGDLDGNGTLDLVTANEFSDSVSVARGAGDGSFAPATNFPAGDGPYAVALGDLDRDGGVDAAVACANASAVSFLRGAGNGTFGAASSIPVVGQPLGVAIADLASDRGPDIAAACYSTDVAMILAGVAGGTPASNAVLAAGDGPWGIAAGDFNGDGSADLAVAANNAARVAVLLAGSGGGYKTATLYPCGWGPRSLAIGDLNHDGRPDLVVANYNDSTVTVLLGTGEERLTEDPPASGMRSGYGRGSLYPASDGDFWSFSGQAGDVLTVAAEAPGQPNPGGLRFDVYGPDESLLVTFWSDWTRGYGQSAPTVLPASGRFTVQVSQYSGYTGEYRLRVTLLTPPVQAESEPNDDIANADAPAFRLTNGQNRATVAGFVGTGDRAGDYFSLGSLATGTVINLTLTKPADSFLAPDLQIFRSDGRPVFMGTTSNRVLVLDGDGDYMSRSNPDLPTGSVASAMAWVYPVAYRDGTWNGVVSWGARQCTGLNFLLAVANGTRPSMATWCNDFAPGDAPAGSMTVWNHVAVTLDGRDVVLYMNGEARRGTLSVPPDVPSTNLTIGCTDNPGRYFEGLIDDVSVWGRALTEDEVRAYMYSPPDPGAAGLMGWWNFDDGTAADLTGRGNLGTLHGDAALAMADRPGAGGTTRVAYQVTVAGEFFARVGALAGTAGLNSQYRLSILMADSTIPEVRGTDLPAEGSTTTSVVSRFSVGFSEEMGSNSVVNPANYDLRCAGPDGAFDSADDDRYTVAGTYSGGLSALYAIPDGPLQPGRYRFVVSDAVADRGGTGLIPFRREFSVAAMPGMPAEGRTNDAPAGATGLVFANLAADRGGSGALGRGTIGVGDVDYWSFSAQAGDEVLLAAECPGNPMWTGLRFALVGPAGNPMGSFDTVWNTGLGELGPVALAAAGTYYVRVSRVAYDYRDEYRLGVMLARPPARLESEPNNSAAQADPVALRASVGRMDGAMVGYLRSDDGSGDSFRIPNVDAGAAVDVDLRMAAGEAFPVSLRLFDPSGAEVASAGPGGAALHHVTVTNGGFVARVDADPAARGVRSRYVLDVGVSDNSAPRVVNDNLPAPGAAGLGIIDGFTVTFSENMAPSTVTNAGAYQLREAGPDRILNTVDDIGYLLVPGPYSGGIDLALAVVGGPLQPGVYRLTVSNSVSDAMGNRMAADHVRSFSVGSAGGLSIENRSNGDRASATAFPVIEDPPGLRSGGGHGTIANGADVDYWRFTAASNDALTLGVEAPGNPGSSRLRYRIENASGALLGAELVPAANGRGRLGPIATPAGGTYFVRVSDYADDGYRGEYRFQVMLTASPVRSEVEANDAVGSATALALTGQGSTNRARSAGYISGATDGDFFGIGAVQAGTTVLLDVQVPSNGTLRPIVTLYDGAGLYIEEVDSGSAADGQAEIRITAPATVYAQVRGGQGTGDVLARYVLGVETLPTGSIAIPNLVATSVIPPPSGVSGGLVTFAYAVKNVGLAATDATNWVDRVVLSVNGVMGDGDDIPLGVFAHAGGLDPNASYENRPTVRLPDGMAGDYFLIVYPDFADQVDEGGQEANARASGIAFTVTRDTYPDLRVESVGMEGAFETGAGLTIGWDTANRGTGATRTGFHDRIAVRNVGSAQTVFLREFQTASPFTPGATVSHSVTFTGTVSGAYDLEITTDARDAVYEYDAGGHVPAERNTAVTNFTLYRYFTVSVTTNPPNGGWVTGGGRYRENAVATLAAVPNVAPPPFWFLHWKEAGTVVSTSTNYSFAVRRDRVLAAHFFSATYVPNPPGVDPVTTPTSIRVQRVTGRKDAGADVRLNGAPVVPLSEQTAWTWDVTLAPGTNRLAFTSAEQYGYASTATVVTIVFDDTAPGAVSPLADGAGDGISVALSWTNYDEAAQGADIAEYRVYRHNADFTVVANATLAGTVGAGVKRYRASGLTRGATYWFGVVAVDAGGHALTAIPRAVSATTRDVTAPPDPADLRFDAGPTNLTARWTAASDADGDLAGYRVYVGNEAVGRAVGAGAVAYALGGLSRATATAFRVTSVDNDGNESAGRQATGVTWLPNPSNVAVQAYSSLADLRWDAASPAGLVRHYAVFVGESAFNSVTGMTPRALVTGTNGAVAGLANGRAYHFAVATVNLSGGTDPAVVSVTGTPRPDAGGPAIDDVRFNGAPLANGGTVSHPGRVSVSARDRGGMSRVEFLADGVLRGEDANDSDGYGWFWNVALEADGAHVLEFRAYDSLQNATVLSNPVVVALAPPTNAPAIAAPREGEVFNRASVTVSGTATPLAADVVLFVNNGVAGTSSAVRADGAFVVQGTLQDGTNRIEVAARNRAGVGSRSAPVTVVVDRSAPAAPVGMQARSQAGGTVILAWSVPPGARVAGYHLYRAARAFETVGDATRVNAVLIEGTGLSDLPASDGTYFYRVSAVNSLGTEGLLSAQVSAVSDRTGPEATVAYTSTGRSIGNRFGPGRVSVRLTLSEALQASPFFSIVRTNGMPIAVSLTRESETLYTGGFEIGPGMGSGLAYATLSARDLLGNRGTEIRSGGTIMIDTEGPILRALTVTPAAPIRNVQSSPVSVAVEAAFDAGDLPVGVPELQYGLSGSMPVKRDLPLAPVSATTWRGSVQLAADSGLATEFLEFAYRGVDELGNAGTTVVEPARFQVYQGNLPPVGAPGRLRARALAGGRVELEWDAALEATDYAIYRRGPGEAGLTPLASSTGALRYAETPIEGTNAYAVASVRTANGQSATSGLSQAVTVFADATAPAAPSGVGLSLYGSGVLVSWQAPADRGPLTYRLYRDSETIDSTAGAVPLIDRIVGTNALDVNPLQGGTYYAVSAVDVVGNPSAPSASVYTNLSLLPVNGLTVTRADDDVPVVRWTHARPDRIDGYNLYLALANGSLRLNGALLGPAETTFTDRGYDGTSRRYAVAAVDIVAGGPLESVRRELLLPAMAATLATNETLKRGIMNRFEYAVVNGAGERLRNVRIGAFVQGRAHWSDPFEIEAGAARSVNVAVAGYADLPDAVTVTNAIEMAPNPGERVTVTRSARLAVGEDLLSLEVLGEAFTRGATGRARFVLRNTSEEEIEIVLAVNGGNGLSPEMRFRLVDGDGMVYSVAALRQSVGAGLVTLPSGVTVARIPPGGEFACAAVEVPVPAAAPDALVLRAEIDAVHFHHGWENHVRMDGVAGSRRVSLVETPYYATITNIAPAVSLGNTNVNLAGQAKWRADGAVAPRVPLTLVIGLAGFERTYQLYTDDAGAWSYAFMPESTEGGVYSVYAVHPSVTDRAPQGSFVVQRLTVTPTYGRLTCPRELDQRVEVRATTSAGLTLTNLSLAYGAGDQTGGVLAAGVQVRAEPVASVGARETVTLAAIVRADRTAADRGRIVLRVRSDDAGGSVWGFVTVDTTFLAEAAPALAWTPSVIETGVSASNSAVEQVTLVNRGFAPLRDTRLAMVQTNGLPAPAWVILNSSTNLGDLAVGQSVPVSMTFSPDASVPLSVGGPYTFHLRVAGRNHPTANVPVFAFVDASGRGHALFKVMDIYTGTLDSQGRAIQGLANARIRLVKEEGSRFETNLVTDAVGEALARNLPVGRFSVRVSSPGHQDLSTRIWVKSGVTLSEEYTLLNDLVTVEWSVREITIEDRYEIVLRATYQTDVPAPVVVIEPASVNLPDMDAGDMFQGEFTVKNYGLIRAEDVRLELPTSDSFYRYEFLSGLPETLEAKQVVRVPYRVTCLSRIGDSQEAGGGGCVNYMTCSTVYYRFRCSNGTQFDRAVAGCWFRQEGECGGGGTGGGGGEGGWGYGWITGGTAIQSGTPSPQAVSGPVCYPTVLREEIWLNVNLTRAYAIAADVMFRVLCSVNCLLREYNDDALDLVVKAPGGHIAVQRWFYDNAWKWDEHHAEMRLVRGDPAVPSSPIVRVDRGGIQYLRKNEAGGFGVFANGVYTITESEAGFIWRDTAGNWMDYGRDTAPRRSGNRNGVLAKYLYGADNRWSGIADRNDRQMIWFERDGDGRLVVVRDLVGRRVEYTQTGGRLAAVRDVLGQTTTYEYDAAGHIVRTVDAGGRPTLAAYNAAGDVVSVTDRNGVGNFFEYYYDQARQEYYAKIRSTSGMIKEVWYDRKGETKRVNVNGRVVREIARSGRALTLTDEKGNRTVQEFDERLSLIRAAMADGRSFRVDYGNEFGRPTRIVNAQGALWEYAYDERGNMTRRRDAVGTPAERMFEYVYDADGQLLTVTLIGDSNTLSTTVSYAYDADGNEVSMTDGEGHRVEFLDFDVMGNARRIRDARSNEWALAYDAMGRLTEETDPFGRRQGYGHSGANTLSSLTDKRGGVSLFESNDRNLMTRVVDPLGHSARIEYNSDGLAVRHTDQEGRALEREFDNEGRLLSETDGSGNRVAYTYDLSAHSRVSSRKPVRVAFPTGDPAPGAGVPGLVCELDYDVHQRETRSRDIVAGAIAFTNETVYDAVGNVGLRRNEQGRETRLEHDALGRPIAIRDAGGRVTRLDYDDRDNLIAVTDGKGAVTRYRYDRSDRVVSATRPMGQTRRYAYDAAGDCVEFVDAKGQKTTYAYDAAHRLIETAWFAGTNTAAPSRTVRYSHDEMDNLTGWNDGQVSAAYTYDAMQRCTGCTVNYGSFVLSFTNTYYANGLKKSFTGPDGVAYTYEYDANNRLNGITIPNLGRLTYHAYRWNEPVRMSWPGGVSVVRTYDPLMSATGIQGMDPAGNSLMVRNGVFSVTGQVLTNATEHGTYVYEYDAVEQLTGAQYPSGARTAYVYDLAGHRTNATDSGACTVNANGELLTYGAASLEYDANGNVIRRTIGGRTFHYVYDEMDRLVRVEDARRSVIAAYGYDPLSRRLWKDVGDVRTYFFYSEDGLVGEYDGTGRQTRSYGYHPECTWTTGPLFQEAGGRYYWYLNDHLGTPQRLVDPGGQVAWSGTYDAFGECRVSVQGIENNLRLPGQYFDAETGLHYNWHRYYDPATGRYLQPEPCDRELNLYAYAAGNPLTLTDPEGLCVVRIAAAWGEIIFGFTAAIATGGLGAVPGVLIGLHGMDSAWAGLQGLLYGTSADTFTSAGLQSLGLPPWAANLADAGLSMGGTYAASRVLQPNITGAAFIRNTRLEARALMAQGYSRREAFRLIRRFNAGQGEGFVFHFTNVEGAQGIVSSKEVWATAKGLAGPGVYAGTTPTPNLVQQYYTPIGWGLKPGSHVRIPIRITPQISANMRTPQLPRWTAVIGSGEKLSLTPK